MSMTVKELKKILENWPETDDEGNPTEVWIETGEMLSSPVVNHCLLTWQKHLLLESNAFEDHSDD